MSKRKKKYAIDVLKREIEERKMKLKQKGKIMSKTKLTCSDIEKMVKLEWRDNRPMVADCGDFNLNIFYMRENEYTIYASKGILGGEMYIGTTKSEDEAKQKAQDWIVDIVCSALGVEEEK